MKIIDSDGKEITVTDLELAIIQADDYRHTAPHSNSWMRVYKPTGKMFTKNCSG